MVTCLVFPLIATADPKRSVTFTENQQKASGKSHCATVTTTSMADTWRSSHCHPDSSNTEISSLSPRTDESSTAHPQVIQQLSVFKAVCVDRLKHTLYSCVLYTVSF